MSFPENVQYLPIRLDDDRFMFDASGDESPISTDIVGNQTYPSLFFAYDGTNVYFRLRLNGDPRNIAQTSFRSFSWGILINSSGEAGTYDYLLAVNGLRAQLNLIKNTVKEFNSWNDPAEGLDGRGEPSYSRPIINFDVARVTPADSNFSSNPDFFLDFFIPASTLFSILGVTEVSALQFIGFTATNENNYNKDSLRFIEGFQFVETLSEPVSVSDSDIRADLNVEKTLLSGPSSVIAGQFNTYRARLTVSNPGESAATNVTVNDIIGLDNISSFTIESVGLGTATFNTTAKSLNWTIGNLSAGASVSLIFNVEGAFTTSGTRIFENAKASGNDLSTGGVITPATEVTNLQVIETGGLSGTVLDGNTGLSLSGVTVELLQNGTEIGTTSTNGSGDYSFTSIEPGSYTVRFSKTAYTTVTQPVTVSSNRISTLNLALPPLPGSINGSVTAQGGGVLQNARVTLTDTFGALIGQTVTDAGGSYYFPQVKPGHYTLSVSRDNYQSKTEGVEVSPNSVSTVNFVLSPNPATVNGTVENTTGQPIADALVQVKNEAGIIVAFTFTDTNGQFAFNSIAPGTYFLQASADDFAKQTLGTTLSAGETETLTFRLVTVFGTFTGTVRDERTNIPLPSANVRVIDQSGIDVTSTVTSSNGSYTIGSLRPGSYSIIFSADGYGSTILGGVVEENQSTTVNATMQRLVGSIDGSVTDQTGNPISGALVRLFSENVLVSSIVTDNTGRFGFSNLTPGSYSVTVSAENFATHSQGVIVRSDETSIVEITMTALAGNIAGNVTDNQGNPIGGAVLVLRQAQSDIIVARTVTNNEGVYSLPSIEPGMYQLASLATDFQSIVTGVNVLSNQTSIANFQLVPQPSAITGSVLNGTTGDPIAGASVEVRILDLNGAVISNTFTDPGGQFLVTGLSPGFYSIVASAKDFQTNAASIVLGPNELETVNISLLPSPGALTGTIRNAQTGETLTGAEILINNQNGVRVQSTLSDSEGEYLFNGLPPGDYTIVVSAESFQTAITGVVVEQNYTKVRNISLEPNPGSISGAVTPIVDNTIINLFTSDSVLVSSTVATQSGEFIFPNLAPGSYVISAAAPNFAADVVGAAVISNQTTEVTLSLIPDPSMISGQVSGTDGQPIGNAIIRVIDLNENVIRTGATEANGRYSIGNLPPGSFQVVVSAPNTGSQMTGVTLTPGSSQSLDFVLTFDPGSAIGEIFNPNGDPISGVTVILRDEHGGFIASVLSNSFGAYKFEDLSPGSYNIVATAPNFSTETIGVIIQSNQVSSANITLTNVVGDISGRVVDENGQPITGSNIQLKLLNEVSFLLQTAVAQSDGTFRFDDLAPGRYLINASKEGFAAKTVSVDVTAGSTTNVTVSLSPITSTLAGIVRNELTGDPIAGARVEVNSLTGIFLAYTVSNQDGTFELTNLPPQTVVVSISASSFGSDALTVNLIPNETTNVTVQLHPNPGSLTGFITNIISGNAIPGTVVVISTVTGSEITRTTTDLSGQYLVEGLEPGNYRVVAGGMDVSTQTATITIEPEATAILSFALTPIVGSINGIVRNQETGEAIAGATVFVRLLSPSGPLIASTLSDDDGYYTVFGLEPNSYTLIGFAKGFGTAEATTMVIANESKTVDLLLPQNPGFVNGVVRNSETGEVVPNATVILYTETGIRILSIDTDQNGFYRFPGVTPDQYRLVVVKENFNRPVVGVTIVSDQVETVNINIQPNTGNIGGKVTDSQTHAPIVGALVLVYKSTSIDPVARAVSDSLGNYSITGLLPGVYNVVASALKYSQESVGATVMSGETSIANLSLDPLPASVSGTVTDSIGDPIANATVKLIDLNNVVVGFATTDSNGNYAITNLKRGTYLVLVKASGFAAESTGITLEQGEALNDLDFSLTANPGSIRGFVLEVETGEPQEDVTVSVLNGNGIVIATTVTTQTGSYLFQELPQGFYTLIAIKDGFAQATVGVNVVSEQETNVNLFLQSNPGEIRGTVLDEQGRPIIGRNTSIRLMTPENIILQTVLASTDGVFGFINLSPGNYLLNVAANGYETVTVGVIVRPDETTNVPFVLQPLSSTIVGIVLSRLTEEPVPGSEITVANEDGISIAAGLANQDGRFVITDLPPGSLNVSARRERFGSTSVGIVVDPGEQVETELILAPEPGSLNGVITNRQTEEPIPGAAVQVLDRTQVVLHTVLSDNNGFYQVTGLEPGNYQLIISKLNFSTESWSTEVVPNETTTNDFVLLPNPGAVAGEVFMDNDETGAISLGLTEANENGTPIVGATIIVRLFSPAGPIIASTATNFQGRYVINGLTPGVYTFIASKEGFRNADASDEVFSDQVTEQDFLLSPLHASVFGRVTSAVTGEGLPNTRIRLTNAGGTVVKEVQTDINGNYLLNKIEPGVNDLVALNPEFQNGYQQFTIENQETREINFALNPLPGRIVGTVADMNSDPIPGAILVVLNNENRPITNAITDQNGNYTIEGLAPGEYTVRATASNFISKAVLETVSPNETTTVSFQLEPNPASIRGFVTDSEGNPVRTASVSVFDENGLLIGRGATDLNGEYVIGNLPPGEVEVLASASGLTPVTRIVILTAGEQTIVSFTLSPQQVHSTIRGEVIDATTGNRIDVAFVVLRMLDGTIIDSITTTDGLFAFTGLEAGTYRVNAAASGYNPSTEMVNVNEGETAFIVLELTKRSLIIGGRDRFILVGSKGPLCLTGADCPTIFTLLCTDDQSRCGTFAYQVGTLFGTETRILIVDLSRFELVRV
ncbi:carboxypeptidase regulatory-like domain-containing protein [Pseudalkalibacillus salsuginis]|uniref:carboxypeptidase regulatory-like domain-containing protein n=1 Tax=Pseudalkalibacillus salsuginis TaxID=2910972 RepID=UPI001F3F6D1F|nr:carboxypeptidase regulatory-like domain-containing protein [Pseudalkalibacillus salsuginis]MCF6409864.1 carboxypeptidase regulatory-like domain-containing protein [Pseudalkalibacillus salsuginis]